MSKSKDSIKSKINQKKKPSAVDLFLDKTFGDSEEEKTNPEEVNIPEKVENEKNEKDSNDSNSNADVDGRSHNSLENTLDEMMNVSNEPEKVFRGYYLDEDIVAVLDKLAKKRKKQKGFKSEVINNILRAVFEDYGYLKKK